jgi:polysaccharide export outer membrane protein
LRLFVCIGLLAASPAWAQVPATQPPQAATAAHAAPAVVPPPGYIIGVDDVLGILFWRDKDMTGDVTVRPDGKITLPLLNEVQAAGLTPEQLRAAVTEGAARYVADPNVTIVVRQINSRKVFLVGQVQKPGPYPLTGPTTVLQLISLAGGLLDYADEKNILVMRTENGREMALRFNYKEVLKGRNLKQNVELKPGDTVVVP